MEKIQKKIILFMPSIDGGGVEKNLILISDYLAQNLGNIFLITYDNRFNKFFNKKIKIFNVTKSINPVSKYYKYFRCLILLCIQIIKFSNCIVFSFQANIYCAILHKFLSFKLIARSNSSPSGWSHNLIKKYIFKFFLRSANCVIVNSKEFKKEFKQKFNLDTEMIYNPLNKKEIISKSKKKVDVKFFNKKKCLRIINVARFTDQKDHITLLKSFKEIIKKINARLLILGYGPNETKIKQFIKKNNFREKIKIINFQLNPYTFIKKSDLLILSSKYEGLPNVILEALCLNVFVISSKCPTGPKEILENGKFGYLFNVGDHKDLSEKIIKFMKFKNNSKKMIKLGYKSLDRFDYNLNCEKYLKVIKNL